MTRRRSTSCFGFTLVELLLVIGIIALLVGILLPALQAARRQAQLTRCLATQREIYSAANIHVGTHQGYFPIAGRIVSDTFVFAGGATPAMVGDAGRRKYMYTYMDEHGIKGLTLAPWHAAVATYMGKKTALDGVTNVEHLEDEIGSRAYLKYFICPSHVTDAREVRESLIYTGGSIGWMIQQSYVINEAVFGVNDDMGRLRGKASRIRRPSATMMLSDGVQSAPRSGLIFSDASMGWMTFINLVAKPPVTLADALKKNGKASDARSFDYARHRGRINILYFDGHAETCRITPGDLRNAHLLSQ